MWRKLVCPAICPIVHAASIHRPLPLMPPISGRDVATTCFMDSESVVNGQMLRGAKSGDQVTRLLLRDDIIEYDLCIDTNEYMSNIRGHDKTTSASSLYRSSLLFIRRRVDPPSTVAKIVEMIKVSFKELLDDSWTYINSDFSERKSTADLPPRARMNEHNNEVGRQV
ncbi:unnamed protein product [Gongylonema pulchrum]|uniref:HDAC_interact domain-containing protein n=1 Tax=Gongylonema pulchrum TaxID=637853 RepID=A0A183DA10_9BILA|nr:unnamed protein product [Gongylonema pulchrum]